MLNCGEVFFKHVLGAKLQAGGVYTGVAANMIGLYNVLIYKKLNVAVLIVYKSHNAHRSGDNIKVFQEILGLCKG